MHWEQVGRGALGETTHNPRAGRVVGGVRHTGRRRRWGRAPNTLSVLA